MCPFLMRRQCLGAEDVHHVVLYGAGGQRLHAGLEHGGTCRDAECVAKGLVYPKPEILDT